MLKIKTAPVFDFDFDFDILTALKGWVGQAAKRTGALQILNLNLTFMAGALQNVYLIIKSLTSVYGGGTVTRKTVFIASAVVMILAGCGGEKPSPTAFIDSRDGQVYKTVTIGAQTWMARNLNYAAEKSRCYNNDSVNCTKYGRLYDWETAAKSCPAGWHLPDAAELVTLIDYVGGDSTAGTKLKAAGGWDYDDGVPAGTDDYGFSALPGGTGDIVYGGGNYVFAGESGRWWSAAEYGDSVAACWRMRNDREYIDVFVAYKVNLFSARCIQDKAHGAAAPVPAARAHAAYNITFDANGGAVSPASGTTDADGKLGSLPTPIKSGYIFNGWYRVDPPGMHGVERTDVDEEQVYWADDTVYARWAGIPTPKVTKFTDKRDGKAYRKVTIGKQVWMAENLNYKAKGSQCYGEDGKVENGHTLSQDKVQAYCAKYGRLYNWETALKACPAGWHLASDAEWDTLVNFAGGEDIAGKKLKTRSGWLHNYGTDEYGFSALPGGYRSGYGDFNGDFYSASSGYWWSATAHESGAWGRYMCCGYWGVRMFSGDTVGQYTNLYSVRCVQDESR